MASTVMFESYEEEYDALVSSIRAGVKKLGAIEFGATERQMLLHRLGRDVDELSSLVQQMDLEARSLAPAQQSACSGRVREYRLELDSIRTSLKRAREGGERRAARSELLAEESGYGGDEKERDRLLDSMGRMQKSNQSLDRSKRTMAHTESVGASILGNLQQQRETLMSSRGKLRQTDENVSMSSKILRGMSRRVMTNKLILWTVVLMLSGVVGLMVYRIFVPLPVPGERVPPQ